MYRFQFGIREEGGCRPRGHEHGQEHGHQHGHNREHGRHGGFGEGRGGGRERFGRGFGGGRERMFDQGELRLVLLYLLNDKPSYGYELIKTIEEKLAGGYAPSPGVVYPTLTMLEEEGLATVSTSDAGKKVYTLTDAGREYLTTNESRVQQIRERLDHAGQRFERGRSPQIMAAFMGLRHAVIGRVSREDLTAAQVKKIAEAIDAAAKAVTEV